MNTFYPEKKKTKVIGIVGSLRAPSLNGALLNATKNFFPDWIEFDTFDIGEVPHYDQDVEDPEIPEIVSDFKQKVSDADAIILAAPEYNGSVSGVLKDALDWASRPYGGSSVSGKPIAVLTAVSGRNGGRAVLNHLSLIIDYLDATLIGEPVLLQEASGKFDDQSNISDPETFHKVEKLTTLIAKELSIKAKKYRICQFP